MFRLPFFSQLWLALVCLLRAESLLFSSLFSHGVKHDTTIDVLPSQVGDHPSPLGMVSSSMVTTYIGKFEDQECGNHVDQRALVTKGASLSPTEVICMPFVLH
jgi:hypothetical protein